MYIYMLLRWSVEYIVIRFSFVTDLIKNILTKYFIKNLKVAKFSAANCKPSSEQRAQLVWLSCFNNCSAWLSLSNGK